MSYLYELVTEDCVIDKKYLNILDISVYDTEKKRYGNITGIKIIKLRYLPGMLFTMQYDRTERDTYASLTDFINGKMKFVLMLEEDPEFKQREYQKFQNIKNAFGEDFNINMLIWLDIDDMKRIMNEGIKAFQQS